MFTSGNDHVECPLFTQAHAELRVFRGEHFILVLQRYRRASCGCSFRRRLLGSITWPLLCLPVDRQDDGKRRQAARAFNDDAAVMFFHDAMAHRKPSAGAFARRPRGKKGSNIFPLTSSDNPHPRCR